MRVEIVGGGPGGLYAALLLKRARPETRVTVYERNRADDTFGWGVVFSGATLANFRRADEATHASITASFRRWETIRTWLPVGGLPTENGGEWIRCRGHDFAAISRRELQLILQRRCRELGVELEFETEVASLAGLPTADLVIVADGVNSALREQHAEALGASVEMGASRFAWLGTTLPLEAFTFVFQPTEWGLFQVHAYPFSTEHATWIVECSDETWRKADLHEASEDDTVDFCQRVFADHLDGHPMLSNRSLWRRFPTVCCDRWGFEDVIFLGDAVHTAHFSIGSGTKLAMEDAIALVEALGAAEDADAARVRYEAERRPAVERLQAAAEVSREWFETTDQRIAPVLVGDLGPREFVYSLMTRSGRIDLDELRQRDPEFVEGLEAERTARLPA